MPKVLIEKSFVKPLFSCLIIHNLAYTEWSQHSRQRTRAVYNNPKFHQDIALKLLITSSSAFNAESLYLQQSIKSDNCCCHCKLGYLNISKQYRVYKLLTQTFLPADINLNHLFEQTLQRSSFRSSEGWGNIKAN